MDTDEARKVVETIGRWMELRAQGGYDPLLTGRDFLSEATHSLQGGLLGRLLIDGKEPLKHTPPLVFSRPWYELIESGEIVVEEALVTIAKQTITICQHQWQIVKREGTTSYVISWRPDKGGETHWGQWCLTRTSDSWILSRIG